MDTTFAQGGVALLEGDQVAAMSHFEGAEGHVARLPQEINRLMNEMGWQGHDLDLLAVTIGPGSFSGSRIALGVAKGFSAALGTPVVGISTLELLVAGLGVNGRNVAALLDARRKEVYAGLYQMQKGINPVSLLPPALWDPADFAQELVGFLKGTAEKMVLIGNGLIEYAPLFHAVLKTGCEVADPALWQFDLKRLGLMAQQRVGTSNAETIAMLEPMYLRRADAKEAVAIRFAPP
ncbi:MAG: tRNA (adenosine(37)-N6)-threonylcarbamoyltransferase complex dimerization subunit type 1 TsaB [Magnetococcales bacterium]|nr:tRNA (adenosine(37)-N6)-threonylcarbamoyltransferase complex dimerization subunit type 1 TsaB [Magnetococcales bacterium]MBF0437527.1 tRNA (adenosine(37)-N6)-threonylcarbamoyltransferase complex dimerization subunit type 1 TsaB [Magnetococcales bacterium]